MSFISHVVFSHLHLSSGAAVAAKDNHQTKNEAEVVPVAIIMRFVDAHILFEQGTQESKRHDKTMPQPAPKSGDFALLVGEVWFSGFNR